MITETQSLIDSKTNSSANPFEDHTTSSQQSSFPQMPQTVLRRNSPARSPSVDKSAMAWAEQQQETPPVYALPENPSTIAPPTTVVGVSPPLAQEPVSEREWHETLRELQSNLSALNFARRVGAARKSGSRRFIKSLFNSKSFKADSQGGPQFRESDFERQERVQRIRVLEELVLSGMRKLARVHPEPDARADWHSRAEQFAATIRRGESTNNLEELIANEEEKETILEGLAKGMTLLFMTPVVLIGVVAFGTGAMIYGVGKCVITIGHVMTFGKFR